MGNEWTYYKVTWYEEKITGAISFWQEKEAKFIVQEKHVKLKKQKNLKQGIKRKLEK